MGMRLVLLLTGLCVLGSEASRLTRGDEKVFVQKLEEGLKEFFQNAGTYFSEIGAGYLPEFRASFPLGSLNATGGFFKTSFSYIKEGVHCNIVAKKTISIDVPLTLSSFEAGYMVCDLEVGGVVGTGSVTWKNPKRNFLRATLEYPMNQQNCSLRLARLEVEEFGELDNEASFGLYPFQGGLEVVADWLVGNLESELLEIVRTRIEEAMIQTAKGKGGHICSLFPL